jgi:hypothetical protein
MILCGEIILQRTKNVLLFSARAGPDMEGSSSYRLKCGRIIFTNACIDKEALQ